MKIKRKNLISLIENLLVSEVGLGVGMDPTGATMPRGMKRSEYNQLGDASADPQDYLAAISILPPAFVPAMVLSAILYYAEGKTEDAATTLALSAIFGGGARAINKILPALKAGMKAGGGASAKSSAEAAQKLVKSTEDILKQSKGVIKPPKPHPKLPAKQASAYGAAVGKAMREEGLERALSGSKAIDVFNNFSRRGSISGIDNKVFIIGPRGGVSGFRPKAYYDDLVRSGHGRKVGKVTLSDILKEFFPGIKDGDVVKIYMGVPNAAGTTGKVVKFNSATLSGVVK